jgi:membrane fusion protein (multidrug efflux system)
LDDQNMPTARPIKLGIEVEDKFVVEDGLKDGERIISEGVIKVRPSVPVTVAPDQPKAGAEPSSKSPTADPATDQMEGEDQ